MTQRTAQDPASLEYAAALDELWREWDDARSRAVRVLQGLTGDRGRTVRFTDPIEECRSAQYKAHVASERAVGLMPPLVAYEAHRYVCETLAYCRDTLGAIAAADEFALEIDPEAASEGLHALNATREAYNAAHYASFAADATHRHVPDLDDDDEGPPAWAIVGVALLAVAVVGAAAAVLALLGPGQ